MSSGANQIFNATCPSKTINTGKSHCDKNPCSRRHSWVNQQIINRSHHCIDDGKWQNTLRCRIEAEFDLSIEHVQPLNRENSLNTLLNRLVPYFVSKARSPNISTSQAIQVPLGKTPGDFNLCLELPPILPYQVSIFLHCWLLCLSTNRLSRPLTEVVLQAAKQLWRSKPWHAFSKHGCMFRALTHFLRQHLA